MIDVHSLPIDKREDAHGFYYRCRVNIQAVRRVDKSHLERIMDKDGFIKYTEGRLRQDVWGRLYGDLWTPLMRLQTDVSHCEPGSVYSMLALERVNELIKLVKL